jgi:hypothetical protein
MDTNRKLDTRPDAGELPAYEQPRIVSTSEQALLGELAPVHGVTSPIPPNNEP